MQYPYGVAGQQHHGTGTSGVRSRVTRKHSPAHELAALPKMTRVGKPTIVPLS